MEAREEKTLYELLGVTRAASVQQIRDAYKEIARVYHPDSNFYDEIIGDAANSSANSFFQLLTNAYSVLTNEKRRKEYDETLPVEIPMYSGAVSSPRASQFGKVKRGQFEEKVSSEIIDEIPSVLDLMNKKSWIFELPLPMQVGIVVAGSFVAGLIVLQFI